MKKWTKRVWALLLAVAMMLSFCACSPADDDDEGNQSGSGGWWDSLTSVYPEEEIVEITILAQEYADPGYPRKWSQEGMALVRKIAYERFGLKLKLQEVIGGADNFKTILNTQFASDSKVADVIRFDLDLTELNQYYLKGKILNLSDYAEYMPDVVSTFDEIPSLYQSNCTPEGDILRIPTIAYNVQHVSNWANIRRDWLDALNLKSPTTTEEFRAVLRAFQENDMNGNGKADEVFIAGYGQLNNVLSTAFGCRGMNQGSDSWYVDENGQVYHAMLTEEARNYVEYVASMFKEGLFWIESFTDTGAQEMILINENRRAGKIGAYWDSLLNNIDGYAYGRPDEYNPMLPLSDGTHAANLKMKNYDGHTTVFLTKDCPAPERVVAFYNWCYSKEAATVLYSGVDYENPKYYTSVPATEYYTEEILALLTPEQREENIRVLNEEGKALQARERSLSGYLGANNGLWPMKGIDEPHEIAIDFWASYDQTATRSASDLQMNVAYLRWPYEEGNSHSNLKLAVMTNEQYQEHLKYADLYNYIDEMYKKFMMGVEPMSKWDEFVEECYNQGLANAAKLVQARYDALNK